MTDDVLIPIIEPDNQPPEKPKSKKANLVKAELVSSNDNSALVEYRRNGKLNRCVVPREKIDDDGMVEFSVLDAGIPYGDDFSAALDEQIIHAFHEQGIWTFEDVRVNRQVVIDILITHLVAPALEKLTVLSEVTNG